MQQLKTPVRAHIAIGSNIQPELNIPSALEQLEACAPVTAISTFYRTLPVGGAGYPFLNGVCEVATDIEPYAFKFEILRSIERELGRLRGPDKYAPRTIDLDLALYGPVVMKERDIELPDPEIRLRAFVAVPLAEIAPEAQLPDSGERVGDIAARFDARTMTPDLAFTQYLRSRFVR